MADAGRNGGPIGDSGIPLNLFLRGEGDWGIFERVSMVRSDKDGTRVCSRSGSVTSSHESSPVSSASWLSAKLCRVCVDSRRLMLNLVDEDLVNDSCDGRRSREMLTPESDCNRS